MWNNPWLIAIVGGLIVFIGGTWLIKKIWSRSTAKTIASATEIDPEVTLSSYENHPYNCVEMRNTGVEPIKDLDVRIVYKNNSGEEKQVGVEHFFKENDRHMIWAQFKANALKGMEVVRFRLLQSKSVMDGKVTVVVIFVGIKTRKAVEIRKEFELKL